jgi:hypothetical protein
VGDPFVGVIRHVAGVAVRHPMIVAAGPDIDLSGAEQPDHGGGQCGAESHAADDRGAQADPDLLSDLGQARPLTGLPRLQGRHLDVRGVSRSSSAPDVKPSSIDPIGLYHCG